LRDKINKIGGYFVSTVVTAAVTFFSVPLLIRTLGQAEFGKWSLVEPFILLLSQVLLLGIDYGIVKHVNFDKLPPFPTFSKLLLAAQPFILSILVIAFIIMSSLNIPYYESSWLLILIYVESFLMLMLSAFRAANHVVGYATASVTKALIFLFALLLPGLCGWMIITAVREVILWRLIAAALAIALSFMVVGMGDKKSIYAGSSAQHKTSDLYRNAVAYGLPMLITGLLANVIEYADRYILKSYFDYVTLAHYVVYLKIAAILNPLIAAPFALWWPTERFRRMEDADGGKAFFRDTAVLLLAVYLVAGGVLWFFSPWLITWFAPGIPLEADIVLILILSVIFLGMGAPMNIGLLNAGRTHMNVYGVLVGALLHLVFCFLLIPRFGIAGAAVATAFSYLVYALAINYLSQRCYHVPFAYARMMLLIAIAIAELLLIQFFIENNNLLVVTGKTGLFIVLFAMPFKWLTNVKCYDKGSECM
jgi:O-antigen/teichoic acid export membrane protein